MEAELADGTILEFPDGTDPQVIQATVKKMMAGNVAPVQEQTKTESKIEDKGYLASLGAGIGRGVGNVALTAQKGIGHVIPGDIGDWLIKDAAEGQKKLSGEVAPYKAANPLTTGGGQIVGEVATTWPIGGLLGKGVSSISQSPKALAIAEALRTGGMGTQAAGLPTRMLAGGTVGAASDLMTGGEGTTGAAIGSVLPAGQKLLGVGAGKVYDALTGNLEKVRAGKVARDVAGADREAIKLALAKNAGKNMTASQAAFEANNDLFHALGKRAEDVDTTSYFRRLKDSQTQSADDLLKSISGGDNQTEARLAEVINRKVLNQATSPMREVELEAANTAGKKGKILEALIEQKRLSNARAAQDAGGFYSEFGDQTNQAWKTADRKLGWAGQQKIDRNVARAKENYSASEDFAAIARQRNAEKEFAQRQLASLEEHGLKPLDTTSITNNLKRKLSMPQSAGNKKFDSVIGRVVSDIEDWKSANGGIIDADALYAIRKNSVNQAVEDLTRGLDPKSSAKFAAEMLAEIRPKIDDAIEAAGGSGWRDYLKAHAAGEHIIDQDKMGAKALEIFRKSPAEFERLASGDSPKVVEKIFGQGKVDLGKEMGSKAKVIEAIGEQVKRNRLIDERALTGSGGLSAVLKKDAFHTTIPNYISWKLSAAKRGLDIAEEFLNEKTMKRVYEAMKTPQGALDLINTLPAHERTKVLKFVTEMNSPVITPAATVDKGGR